MKRTKRVIIAFKESDFVDNEYLDCDDCALARAANRVVKSNYTVTAGGVNFTIREANEQRHRAEIPPEISNAIFDKYKDAANKKLPSEFVIELPSEFVR